MHQHVPLRFGEQRKAAPDEKQNTQADNDIPEFVDESVIAPPLSKAKGREAKIAAVMEGREGREEFGSRKGNISHPHSTTNKEKSKKKNFVMVRRKREIQGKVKRSLRDQQKVLRRHVEHIKKQK